MKDERSKRLGKILESANEFEARQRRNNLSSAAWGIVIVILLVGMFFAGRAFYAPDVSTDAKNPNTSKSSLAADSMTPGPTPADAESSNGPTTKLPEEVQLKSPVELQIKRGGKVVGIIPLQAGDSVRPIERDGETLKVTWGEGEGTIPVSETTLKVAPRQ